MAYKTRRRASTRRAAPRRSSTYRRSRVSRPAKRSVRRRASGGRAQTVRIELITSAASEVARPDRLMVKDTRPQKAKF